MAARLRASRSRLRRAATGSGWRAGSGPAISKPTSFTQPAWLSRASIAGRKTDRLDTGLLKRVFLGWLRGEPDHCHMVAIPTLAEEDAKRPNREREGLVREGTPLVNWSLGKRIR